MQARLHIQIYIYICIFMRINVFCTSGGARKLVALGPRRRYTPNRRENDVWSTSESCWKTYQWWAEERGLLRWGHVRVCVSLSLSLSLSFPFSLSLMYHQLQKAAGNHTSDEQKNEVCGGRGMCVCVCVCVSMCVCDARPTAEGCWEA